MGFGDHHTHNPHYCRPLLAYRPGIHWGYLRGRHVILICDSVSCWIMGFDKAREHLCRRLGVAPGGTTADGRFTLLPIVCLGACDRAPAMMVDGDLHGNLDADAIDRILTRYP